MSKCIFCLTVSGQFLSEEHIFPESLGNKTKILPAGCVCDFCNNGVLSILDSVFVQFDGIAMMKALHQIPSKHGQLKALFLQDTKIKHRGSGHVEIQLSSNEQVSSSDNGAQWTSIGRTKLTPSYIKQVARAILKQAYECAFLDHGPLVLEGSFDPLREAILTGKNFDSYLAIKKQVSPDPTKGGCKYIPTSFGGVSGLIAVSSFFNIQLGTVFPFGSDEGMPLDQFNVIHFSGLD